MSGSTCCGWRPGPWSPTAGNWRAAAIWRKPPWPIPSPYRASQVPATGFGALTIINRFEEYGVPIRRVINCGGIAEKNPLVMQIYADIMGRTMEISRSAQTCALGRP